MRQPIRANRGRTPDRYDAYISSPAWRQSEARLEELKAADYRCRLCYAGGPAARLSVHHRTYERLGHELPTDLTTLCWECHRLVTSHLRRRTNRRWRPLIEDVRQLVNRALVDSNAGPA